MEGQIFVYGTLKRGQCRARFWPRIPVRVVPAWTRGTLYDTGPYPALVGGEDRVLGELWTFSQVDLAPVMEALDEIEGTSQPGETNEYDRCRVKVMLLKPTPPTELIAETYFFARRELLPRFRRLGPQPIPGLGEFVQWP